MAADLPLVDDVKTAGLKHLYKPMVVHVTEIWLQPTQLRIGMLSW